MEETTSEEQLNRASTRRRLLTPTESAAIIAVKQTSRILLRRPHAEDELALFAIHEDPATNQYNPDSPDPNLATSEETL